jgi:type II secretory pathway pseudopilin PulG
MGLHGQDGQRGYAMAALLVSIAVMGVLMSAAMPAYRHLALREKESELAFRGEQYARAIALYRAKNGNQFPPSIDVLVQGKYLRKKYKDPLSPDGEFRLVLVGNQAGQNQPQGPGRSNQPPQGRGGQTGGAFAGGGLMGVASKSTQTSIRIYKGQTRYDLWPFTFNMVNRPGGMTGPGVPGGQPQPGVGRGGRGIGPGGRGVGPGGRGIGPGRGGRGGQRGVGPGGRGTIFEPVVRPGGRGGGTQPNQSPDL